MADAVTTRYIYPPNWEGFQPGDGDLRGRPGNQGAGHKRYIVHLTNISDGTGETGVKKVVISDLYHTGKPALRSVIEWIEYDIYGLDVTFHWETDAINITMVRLPGGSDTCSGKIRGPLTDPRTGDGTDGTGDILLSTTNSAAGDSYDIRMCIRPKVDIRPGINN